MIVRNPFLYITPRNKDLLIGRIEFLKKVEKTVLSSLDKPVIVAVNGEFGIGKTLFIEKAIKKLEKKKSIKLYDFDFNLNTLNDLRNIPTEKKLKKQIVIVVDRFELILSLTPEIQKKILKIMGELSKAKVTIIIATSSSLIKKVINLDSSIKRYFKILNVPALNFDETKELILSRLNESRPKKSNKLEPFTNKEVKMIHKQAKGNPRLVLLLCATLFEEKF